LYDEDQIYPPETAKSHFRDNRNESIARSAHEQDQKVPAVENPIHTDPENSPITKNGRNLVQVNPGFEESRNPESEG